MVELYSKIEDYNGYEIWLMTNYPDSNALYCYAAKNGKLTNPPISEFMLPKYYMFFKPDDKKRILSIVQCIREKIDSYQSDIKNSKELIASVIGGINNTR